jgi:hypothetical protein
MEKVESTAGIPVFIAKTVDLSRETIEALSESLSEKIVEKLSSAIVDKFFQGAERLCTDADSGLLGLILRNHVDEILKKAEKEQKEADILKRAIRLSVIPNYGYPKVDNESRIDVAAENRKWEQQNRKDDGEL